ncbi:MAG: hypothetical protein FI731_01340 [SAR202 cluster bacterium]|nr:hypothetical protein [SAR202 cluster bacterium]
MSKPQIWFADLTHTAQGISAATFPLGVSYVLSYAKKEMGGDYEFRLFKFPSQLDEALREATPAVLCFSNYSWNFELAYKFASLAKARNPELITVFGGPNFPTDVAEKEKFLERRTAIDFYIELEGEMGFVDLVRKLEGHGLNSQSFKNDSVQALNTCYHHEGSLVTGPVERIRDIDVIPSPYLSGVLDEFFDLPLIPMIETTRGCPFSCTFCADGIATKNKVERYKDQRVIEELKYVAERAKDVDELIITDLNFAMYQQDLDTAQAIAEIQEAYDYPKLISASAGKNKPKRTIEVASILEGWTLGASIQSTDSEVLSAIKRSNISSAAYQELVEFGNSIESSKTHSELILGLPNDSRAKHFESLRFGIDNNVNSLRMFQAMLLVGTEMASPDNRKQYGLNTKFRTIPGCLGIYEIYGEQHSVAEIEEIIVGSDSLTSEDYLDCRIMNLIVETFYNNAIFEEVFAMVRSVGGSVLDCLVYIKEHPEFYSPRLQEIVDQFVVQTTEDLFDTFEEAEQYVLTADVIERYVGGELGTNELLLHRALLFSEFEEICDLLFRSVKESLNEQGLLSPALTGYLEDLQRFTKIRKHNPFYDTEGVKQETFNYDFEAIRKADYRVDPDSIAPVSPPVTYEFFHKEDQKRHIAGQVRIYADSPVGLGKLLQNSNLKLVFRDFSRVLEGAQV